MSPSFPSDEMALTHILTVADVDRARDFYRDVLGATVYREYGGTSCVLQAFGTWLLLVTGGGPTPDKPTVTFVAPADPDVVSHSMTIRVPDARDAHATLVERGAVFLAPLEESDWEVRGFFRDPDGHLLEISEAKAR
jgi:catechol 2,3-dioxygenase-like lactoylglutathione lyase family enzyme